MRTHSIKTVLISVARRIPARRPLAALALALVASACAAQDYPSKATHIIIGSVAGGGPDVAARSLGAKLTELLGQPFVVENRPGAGTTLASTMVRKAPPDGYTLTVGDTGQFEIAPFVYKSLGLDTLKDMTPIALLSSEPLVLVANPKSGIRTLDELIRVAKANPGKVSYGSSGVGTVHHLSGEALRAGLGLNMVHIPYKGSGQSVPALLAGDVPVIFAGPGGVASHVRAGTLVVLATTMGTRLQNMPDVPSLAELIKGYDFQTRFGVMGPAGMQPAVVAKLTGAIKVAVASPEYFAKYKDTGINVAYGTPAEYTEFLKVSLRKFEQAVKSADIKGE